MTFQEVCAKNILTPSCFFDQNCWHILYTIKTKKSMLSVHIFWFIFKWNWNFFRRFYTVINDQFYSNTRVPTQVSTSRHESTGVWRESIRINTSPTWVDTSLTRVNTSLTQVSTNQHKSKRVLDELTWVNTSPTQV